MSDILCFGEALIDLRAEPDGDGLSCLPQPGGAPANVAVGVARLGGRAAFAGQVGDDAFGHSIRRALAGYGVNLDALAVTGEANTALALVSLDGAGERSFRFYRQDTADLRYRADQLPASALADAGLFHLCSNTLTEPAIRDTSHTLVRRARDVGCLISLDVNFRPGLWPRPAEAAGVIETLAGSADLVKFSREELEALYGAEHPRVIDGLLARGVHWVVVTDGPGPITAFARPEVWAGPLTVPAPSVTAVDTTAAGDAFVAGLLFRLRADGVTANRLPRWLAEPGQAREALGFAARCGAAAATRPGAFAAMPALTDLG